MKKIQIEKKKSKIAKNLFKQTEINILDDISRGLVTFPATFFQILFFGRREISKMPNRKKKKKITKCSKTTYLIIGKGLKTFRHAFGALWLIL